MQEFVLKKKTIVGHCLGKYLNRTLIIQNILLKWSNDWHKSTKKPNQQMQGWPAEEGCRASGAEGTGIPNQQSDSRRQQPACHVSSRSVQPFCQNSRLCPITGKNAGVGGNFGEKERVNCRQHKLVRWVGEGWGYHVE